MTEIPIITSRDISIREIEIPQVNTSVSNYTGIPLGPPVVVNLVFLLLIFRDVWKHTKQIIPKIIR